jgi:hypothetical protein
VKRSQKVALAAAADSLSRELKSLGLPLRYKRKKNFERIREIDGWWISVADWDGRPSVGICIDSGLGLDEETMWTGFWLPIARRQEIVDLNDRLPDELQSGTELSENKFSRGRRWKLLRRPSERSLHRPFIEHYTDSESYIGIYQKNALGGFDIVRAAAFVQGVIRSVDPSTKTAKKSASPARLAYIKYAKRFEVRITPLHHRLQERFARFLRASRKKDIEQNLGGVDLRYRVSDGLILCEVKPCTPETVRFAVRAAMGQLLDYRQSFAGAAMQIVLSKKPASRELDLALSNNFSVAFPSDRSFHIEWPK